MAIIGLKNANLQSNLKLSKVAVDTKKDDAVDGGKTIIGDANFPGGGKTKDAVFNWGNGNQIIGRGYGGEKVGDEVIYNGRRYVIRELKTGFNGEKEIISTIVLEPKG